MGDLKTKDGNFECRFFITIYNPQSAKKIYLNRSEEKHLNLEFFTYSFYNMGLKI